MAEKIYLEDVVKDLLTFIGKNLEMESIFVNPFPSATIGVKILLDKIAALRRIETSDNGREFNIIMEQLAEDTSNGD